MLRKYLKYEILFEFLVLAIVACSVANGLEQDLYQYHDSQDDIFVTIPPTYPRSCPLVDCSWVANRQSLYPDVDDPRYFYRCVQNGGIWKLLRLACQCGTYFDAESRSCQLPINWRPWCSFIPNPFPPPFPCCYCNL